MNHRRGFTLIELVLVLVLAGALAAYAAPGMLAALRGWNEVGFRDQLKSTLEYARKSAVGARRYVCVNTTVAGNGVKVTFDPRDPDALTPASANCTSSLGLPGMSGAATDTLTAPGSVTIGVPTGTVVFDPLGRAWGPATDCTPSSTTQYCWSVQESGSAAAQIVRLERQTGYVH